MRDKGWVAGTARHILTAVGRSAAEGGATIEKRFHTRFGSALRPSGVLAFLLLAGSFATAQRPQPSKPLSGQPWDYGFWMSGGFSVPGGTKDTQMLNAGVRLGKVLTDDHGNNFLRGNFEWSADLYPLYCLWQPGGRNAYGVGFNAVNLKWNLTKSSRRIPFFELGGGTLFTNTKVPANTSRVNFVSHGTLGLQLFNNERRAITASIRYEHISNAGLATPNPGINTVQFLLGMNWFK